MLRHHVVLRARAMKRGRGNFALGAQLLGFERALAVFEPDLPEALAFPAVVPEARFGVLFFAEVALALPDFAAGLRAAAVFFLPAAGAAFLGARLGASDETCVVAAT